MKCEIAIAWTKPNLAEFRRCQRHICEDQCANCGQLLEYPRQFVAMTGCADVKEYQLRLGQGARVRDGVMRLFFVRQGSGPGSASRAAAIGRDVLLGKPRQTRDITAEFSVVTGFTDNGENNVLRHQNGIDWLVDWG